MGRLASGPGEPLAEPLTPRELDVLSHLAAGRTDREIADLLVLSLNTVKWYARQIYGKLGVDNRRQAVVRARELGLLARGGSQAKPPHNLPAQLTTFLGRRQTLVEIGRLFRTPATRLVTLTGPGGIGKTRLAIEYAWLVLEEERDRFPDGIFFVPLSWLSDPAAIAPAVARAVGFQLYGGNEAPEQQLVQYLANKRQLLVLDNFEHLLDEDSIQLLVDILAAGPGIRMLVTSRSRLNVHGEHLIPLLGLETPAPEEMDPLPDRVEQALTFSGIQLFLRSARRVRPGFALSAQNLLPAVRICSLVQGFPLGIELAAGWMRVLEPEEIASELEHGLDILETDARNVPQHQRSLRAVLDASWKLLTEQERQAVQSLSVFEDGFDREGAQGGAEVSIGTLAALVDKSWIEPVAGGRFQMHELLCRYGREKLAGEPVLEAAACDRHSRYYCDWLRQQEAGMWGASQEDVLNAIDADIGNVHAACIWAAAQGHVRRLGQAAQALGLFHFQWRADYRVGQAIFQQLADTLPPAEDSPAMATAGGQRTLVRLLGWQSTFTGLVGNLAASENPLRQALALLDGPALAHEDIRFERAHIAWQSGYVRMFSDPERARQYFLESIDLFGQVGYDYGLAHAQLGLGRAARGVHDFEEARKALTSSLALHRKLGNRRGESEALSTLSGLADRQGRFDEAESLAQQSLALTPEVDRFGIAFGLAFLGRTRLSNGRFAEAETPSRQALALHDDLGMRRASLHWRSLLATVYLHTGNYAAALTEAQRMVSEARVLDDDQSMHLGLLFLSELALVEGTFDQAAQHLRESPYPANRDTTSAREYGRLAVLGLAALGLGQLAEARQHLVVALGWAYDNDFIGLMMSLSGLALLATREGDAERAVELYALATRYPFVANSRWFEDVVGQHISAAAATLSPDIVRAARERGRAMDLDWVVADARR